MQDKKQQTLVFACFAGTYLKQREKHGTGKTQPLIECKEKLQIFGYCEMHCDSIK